MTQAAKLYFIHATSPLHAGVGTGIDAINLPTARERSTGYPFLPGSSVKGVLREVAERLEESKALTQKEVFGAFGPPTEYAGDARGGLVFSDASLLALPVRSLFGTFAWVTCPYILGRLSRDTLEAGGPPSNVKTALETLAREGGAPPKVATTAVLDPTSEGNLHLEELLIPGLVPSAEIEKVANWIARTIWSKEQPAEGGAAAATSAAATLEAARASFSARLVVVKDDYFGFFSRTATEIRHRVKIDSDTGTAASSGPWTEEHIPAETLLHGLVIGRPTRYFDPSTRNTTTGAGKGVEVDAGAALKTLRVVLQTGSGLRFGGKASAGMGRARMQVAP
ncbi:MAG TPA: type III-B CRISPR module RAMP protein Cmr4 [Kofleriaceae bacterium]|nr:type III-B CRISPR module RAMP protein Cmr4 [Kofleriaceae bacterium]